MFHRNHQTSEQNHGVLFPILPYIIRQIYNKNGNRNVFVYLTTAFAGRMMPSYCKARKTQSIIFWQKYHFYQRYLSKTTHLLLEPFHAFLLGNTMFPANLPFAMTSINDGEAGTTKDHVEIHTIDTNWRIVFDTQINVFLNTEAKVSRFWKAVLPQFIFANLHEQKIHI